MAIQIIIRLLICLTILSVSICHASDKSKDKLIFAIDLIRHGDRTPLKDIPTVHSTWKEGLGELTPEGMQQEFQLGQKWRNQYVKNTALLPARYQGSSMYVRSTDYDRTLMSAESALIGLYPLGTGPSLSNTKSTLPSSFQPIPIHTKPKENDTLLMPHANMEEFNKLLKKYVYDRQDWQEKTKEVKPQFVRWSQLTGISVTSLAELESLADTLYIYKLHQVPLPKGMTTKDRDDIIAAGQWAFVTKYRPYEMGKATGNELLVAIANYLQQASIQPSALKFVLLSGHDSTILSLMSAMKVPLNEQPHYASNLNFSLYQTQAQQYVIKVNYNGRPVTLPGCEQTTCPLEKFLALANESR